MSHLDVLSFELFGEKIFGPYSSEAVCLRIWGVSKAAHPGLVTKASQEKQSDYDASFHIFPPNLLKDQHQHNTPNRGTFKILRWQFHHFFPSPARFEIDFSGPASRSQWDGKVLLRTTLGAGLLRGGLEGAPQVGPGSLEIRVSVFFFGGLKHQR